ncbi:uncharacterized protein LOC123889242 isoform X3 [Trifolium pratense]|nr:uncharacterized protein LOC123889242 isoform X3 [Trifolium pratense]
MLMAADQRRKRLNGASMGSYGSQEQYRTKRKNFGPPVQSDLTMKSHISVEWDANHQRVVAKREQVGISWRQMRPFARFDHNGHKVLADVFALPEEIFDLDSLSEVLSYEVWNTQLLDNEKNFLKQFLPGDLEPNQVVQELLSGDDFHFGNPVLKWGTSLCSGELHPDMIVYQEQHLKSEKRAYFSQLHNYHKDMIGFLSKLKESWEACKDPEKEILPKILRSKNDIEKNRLSNLDEFRYDDHDGNLTVASGSYSWGAEEKAYDDNQISSMGQGDELRRRVHGKDFNKCKPRNMMASSDLMLNVGGRPKKGDKLHMENFPGSDGEKYMSYIKISKKQHELVKNLKLSCKNIPASTLNCVLGDLNNFHVQPYKLFIKEEQKNLHEHWLQLVKKHLPASYANWTERLIQKHAMRNSLLLEMKDRSNIEDEDFLSTRVQSQDKEDGDVNNQSSLEDDEDSIVRVPENPSLHNKAGLHSSIMKCQDNPISEGAPLSSNEESIARFQDNPSLHNSYHSGDDQLHHSHVDLEKGILSQGDDASHNKTEHSRIMNSQDDPIGEGALFSFNEDSVARFPENPSVNKSYHSGDEKLHHLHIDLDKNTLSNGDDASQNQTAHSRNSRDDSIGEGSSDGHAWQAAEMSHSYYDLPVTHNYTADGLSLVSSQINQDKQIQMISPESNLHQEGTGKELLQRQSDDGPFSSYRSQDQIGLIQSFINDKGVNSFHYEQKRARLNFLAEQKRAGLNFQASNDVQVGAGQFSSHFKESLQTSLTLDQGHRQTGKVFVPENISGNIYSDAGRYLNTGQYPLSAGNITDWAVGAPHMVAPSQSHVNTAGNIPDWDVSAPRMVAPSQSHVNTAGNILDWDVSAPRMVAPSQPHVNNFIGQPWLPSVHQVQGTWNGSGNGSLSSQILSTGGNSDQGLFSVLSQCNQLHSGSPYESIRHTDQFLSPRTYGVIDAGTHRINAVVPPSSHPLDYFSGRDAPGALLPDDITWMNLPPQNPALNDQIGKSYLRSWNR